MNGRTTVVVDGGQEGYSLGGGSPFGGMGGGGGWMGGAALPPGQVTMSASAAGGYGASPTIQAADPTASVFKLVHKLLRGRYVMTIGLAFCMALVGALLGWTATGPKFKTTGQIRFVAQRQGVMGRDDPFRIDNVQQFISTQSALLKNERVIQSVITSDEFRALGVEPKPDLSDDIADMIEVTLSPQSQEIVNVSVVDKSRPLTETVVSQAIRAYERIFAPEVSISNLERTIESAKEDIERKIAGKEQEIKDASGELGVAALSLQLDALNRNVIQLDSEIKEIEIQLARIEASRPVVVEEGKPPAPPAPKTPQEIALIDPTMRQKLDLQRQLSGQLTNFKAQGFTEEHQSVRRVKKQLDGIKAEIEEYARNWGDMRVPVAEAPAGTQQNLAAQSEEELKARLGRLKQKLTEWEQKLSQMSRQQQTISSIQRELQSLYDQQNDLRRRQAQIDVQRRGAAEGERIEVLSYGKAPMKPTVDKRKQLAAAGFVLGGGLPVALMLLVGMIDRRVRYSDETTEGGFNAPLLGILPILPKELDDEEQRATAAHCVHQIRLLLQLNGASTGAKVFALTSPTAGDGKTSLALAMGMSFAASGSRTVMVDFDMVGTGLSSSLDMRGGRGVVDAIRQGSIDGIVQPTQVERLHLVPSNPGDDIHVARMSATAVSHFIDQLREQYDIVLLDTGPILGSLEASMVCGKSDGVVLVVGRGQHHSYVKRAIAQVMAVGGRVVGLVFNRAAAGDFRRNMSSASMRSVGRALPSRATNLPVVRRNLGKAGAIATTVAMELQPEDCTWRDGTRAPRDDRNDGRTDSERRAG